MSLRAALAAIACLIGGSVTCLAQRGGAVPASPGDCPAENVRNTGRAILCGRIVDSATGRGIGGGNENGLFSGTARFVRNDGTEMNGQINPDGTFGLNVAGGFGRLTLSWSCRRSRVLSDTITLAPGTGTARTFRVVAVSADTLCRVPPEDPTDNSSGAVERWLQRGACWRIHYEPWQPRLPRGQDVSSWIQIQAPRRVDGRDGRSQSFRDSLDANANWRFRGWRPMRGDSIMIVWSTGFQAVTLTLGASGDSLSGTGLWTYDVILTDSLGFVDTRGLPRTQVSARPAACP